MSDFEKYFIPHGRSNCLVSAGSGYLRRIMSLLWIRRSIHYYGFLSFFFRERTQTPYGACTGLLSPVFNDTSMVFKVWLTPAASCDKHSSQTLLPLAAILFHGRSSFASTKIWANYLASHHGTSLEPTKCLWGLSPLVFPTSQARSPQMAVPLRHDSHLVRWPISF